MSPKKIKIELFQIIINLIFVILLIMVTIGIITAFASVHQESLKVQELIEVVKRDAGKPEYVRDIEIVILRLEAVSTKAINSQTMSFIFQILSATLIAIGVYVIRRTNKNSILTIKKTKQIGKIGDTNWDETNINAWLLFAYQSSFSLRSDNSNESQIPLLRDNLVECKNLLERAMEDERGFPGRHIKRFNDISVNTRERLKKVRQQMDEYILKNPNCGLNTDSFQGLIEICENIITLIKDERFKINYDKIKKSLTRISIHPFNHCIHLNIGNLDLSSTFEDYWW